jgi:hypothetical protein
MMRRRRHRIYLKYYAGTDLESALGWKGSLDEKDVRANPVTESFIWHVFTSLVTAVRALQTGHHDPYSPHAPPNWKPITHLDIGLRNVFIEDASDANVAVSDTLRTWTQLLLKVPVAPGNSAIRLWSLTL